MGETREDMPAFAQPSGLPGAGRDQPRMIPRVFAAPQHRIAGRNFSAGSIFLPLSDVFI